MITTTYIAKYAPGNLQDFQQIDSNNVKTHTKTTFLLNTLTELDDLNIMLIGGTNSGKTTLINAILRDYYGIGKLATIPEANIMFINNLKEQGIQFFRNEMRTFCQSQCTIYGKKKVIVVDDMDNINKQSQQVFRNYIDKYKSNIHFISSCTNTQKVIESLQSRLHIIRISPPTEKQMEQAMDRIIKDERIQIDAQGRAYLLENANGSIRNIINNLEKIAIYAKGRELITREICERLCSTISFRTFAEYLTEIKEGNIQSAISTIYYIYDFGYSVIDILEYFFIFIKQTDLITEEHKYRVIPLLCKYITAFYIIHESSIELALFTNDLHACLHGPTTV